MSVKATYKGEEILNITETEAKTLKTSGKYCEADILIENIKDGSGEGYMATSVDNGDGTQTLDIDDISEPVGTIDTNKPISKVMYGDEEIPIQGGGVSEITLKDYLNGEVEFLKISDKVASLQIDSNNLHNGCKGSKFISFRISKMKWLEQGWISNCDAKLIHLSVDTITNTVNFFRQGCIAKTYSAKNIIFNCNAKCGATINSLTDSSISRGEGFLWIPDLALDGTSLVEHYKNTTNLTAYASQYKVFSEAPVYDNSVIYTAGDVCQHNGKFYCLCYKEAYLNDEIVIGHAPSGTDADNDYWEYVAEVNS